MLRLRHPENITEESFSSCIEKMSIPTDMLARGCSAHLPQPIDEAGMQEADGLVQALYHYNGDNVVFRSSYNEEDIRRHVFRWSSLPPDQVFTNGFQADAQGNTSDSTYYNLHEYVYSAGRPMETHRNNYVFVSTTLNSAWTPQTGSYRDREVWRYEIYAPGGIWVAQTFKDSKNPKKFKSQQEVAFVRGINRQYIRSAQRFRLVAIDDDDERGRLRRERVDQLLLINPYIDPASHPTRRLLHLRNPVDYCVINEIRTPLSINYTDPEPRREKRDVVSVVNASETSKWYGEEQANIDGYINAAFRSSYTNEAYLFMRNEYVLVNYAPGTTDDKVLNGPLLICDGFPSLAGTAFAEHGLDCAFGSHDSNEAYIFTSNLCAHINFAPRTTDDYVIKGPVTIAEMFPFFKGTGFDDGVDAAFESSANYEAYVFKGNQYALINYKEPRLIDGPKKITDGYYSLKNTIFESGIEAAFASHSILNEAYLFKEDYYALINFPPGETEAYIIDHGPKKITSRWPSLATILPQKNHGLDLHEHSMPDPKHGHDDPSEHVHDEL